MNNDVKFDIYLCKDDFKAGNTGNIWHFYVDEQGLWPRQASGKNLININIDYSILVSVLGQGYIRCLNNLTASGQGGLQLADTLRKTINKFVLISYQNFDEILTLLQHEDFDLIEYLINKDSDDPQKSLLRLFSMVNKVETKQLLGNGSYHVGYHFNDFNSVISYNVDFFNTAIVGAQFASYLAMFKILVNRINNPYAFAILFLFLQVTEMYIGKIGGYDSLEKMKNITTGTCKSIHDFINNPQDGENKIFIFMKKNPKGFMLMNTGIPVFK